MICGNSILPLKKRILIVDDHAMLREGLARLIGSESDLTVCGEAGEAFTGLDLVTSTTPDLVLSDISLPGKNGIEFIKDLRAIHPDQAVLVVSIHDEAIYAERALKAGAKGYIMKHEGGQRLLIAIRQVLDGKVYVSDKVAAKILNLFSGNGSDVSPVERLTDREFEIFQLVGRGRTTAGIARELHISPKTVEVHRAHIKEKLPDGGVSRADLICGALDGDALLSSRAIKGLLPSGTYLICLMAPSCHEIRRRTGQSSARKVRHRVRFGSRFRL